MAKMTIVGDAGVITSTLKLEDIRLLEKYRPKALVEMGGEDGKEPVFAIGSTSGEGSINNVGVSFGRESRDANKFATITVDVREAGEDVQAWAADKYGVGLTHLNTMEQILPAIIESVKNEKAAMVDLIQIAGVNPVGATEEA